MRPIDRAAASYSFRKDICFTLDTSDTGLWEEAMDLITVFGISALLCVAIGITCSGSRAR
jgi:ABC-type proline/glycine betaine transport system permease subunit